MFDRIAAVLAGPLRALSVRFDATPLSSVAAVTEFVRTRASHTGQTALYAYLRARMGTRYRVLFEDETFAAAIRAAAVKVFVSCLADLTVHAAAVTAERASLTPEEAADLARRCYRAGLAAGLAEVPPDLIPGDRLDRFEARLASVDWASAARSRETFRGGERDLIAYAPVIEAFKEEDAESVHTSFRMRWADIREQFGKRLDAAGVAADLRRPA